MELRIVTRRRAARIFAPCPFSLSFDVCSLWRKRSRRHNNSSKQQQSQPNIVVALGRSLYVFLFPSRFLACQRSF